MRQHDKHVPQLCLQPSSAQEFTKGGVSGGCPGQAALQTCTMIMSTANQWSRSSPREEWVAAVQAKQHSARSVQPQAGPGAGAALAGAAGRTAWRPSSPGRARCPGWCRGQTRPCWLWPPPQAGTPWGSPYRHSRHHMSTHTATLNREVQGSEPLDSTQPRHEITRLPCEMILTSSALHTEA